MNTINDRVAKVISDLEITKTEFANKLNISQPTVSQICSGRCGVSDRVVSDICRVFRVNESWLRTGTGPPYRAKSRPEELAEIFGDLMVDETTKAKIIRSLAEMPEEFFDEALQLVQKFLDQYNKQ